MEKKKVWEAQEKSREDDEDVASGEDVGYSHKEVRKESNTLHSVKEMDIESILCAVQEIERKLPKNAAKPIEPHDIHPGDRNSGDGGWKETDAAGYGERERNHGSYNRGDKDLHSMHDRGRRLASSKDRTPSNVEGDVGDSVIKRMSRDPSVCTVRELGFGESHLYRDLRTWQSGYSELAGEGGMHPAKGLDGLYQPKEYKAEMSYKNFPDTGCLAASCSIADYPYVDFSTNEFMVMCDFTATDDTQLSLSQGDKVLLLNAVTAEWWWVEHNGHFGYVPATHLRGVYDEEGSDIDDPWQDEEYYGSYKTLKLHLEMLSDQPRTQTYRNVILQNSTALKGKRILDLGCGTGIISFFCAQLAEPEIVYAVEASEIAGQTRKLVEENGYSSIIQVLCQRAEELHLPTKVDVLVSEWMGTCLMFEFMLESVLFARNLWLKEDGVMWPSTARIHLVPCSADKEYASRVLFWNSPYGLDFSALKPMAIQEFFSRPKPDYVLNPEDCLSQPCTLLDVNMKTLNIEDLEKMSSEFQFQVDRDGTFHGFTAWFSVQFQKIDNHEQVELDTGPFNRLTHWKHTLFMMDKPMQVHRGDTITGSAVFKRNPIWRRHLSVTITWSITSSSLTTEGGCKVFPIWR